MLGAGKSTVLEGELMVIPETRAGTEGRKIALTDGGKRKGKG